VNAGQFRLAAPRVLTGILTLERHSSPAAPLPAVAIALPLPLAWRWERSAMSHIVNFFPGAKRVAASVCVAGLLIVGLLLILLMAPRLTGSATRLSRLG
jgi:hypothetical protein